MESMGLAAGVYAGETCDMLMPPVNRLLSVHTFVLDEIDPDGYVAYLFRRSVDRAEQICKRTATLVVTGTAQLRVCHQLRFFASSFSVQIKSKSS